MSKYSKVNNPDRVGKDAKEVIFLELFKGESLENIIDYWATMNISKLDIISVTENPKINQAIDLIKRELENSNRGNISIKELLKK
jgi:hypothetical protein